MKGLKEYMAGIALHFDKHLQVMDIFSDFLEDKGFVDFELYPKDGGSWYMETRVEDVYFSCEEDKVLFVVGCMEEEYREYVEKIILSLR